jgi:hypothetical protein
MLISSPTGGVPFCNLPYSSLPPVFQAFLRVCVGTLVASYLCRQHTAFFVLLHIKRRAHFQKRWALFLCWDRDQRSKQTGQNRRAGASLYLDAISDTDISVCYYGFSAPRLTGCRRVKQPKISLDFRAENLAYARYERARKSIGGRNVEKSCFDAVCMHCCRVCSSMSRAGQHAR